MWFLYIIQKNGKYYTDITTDLDNRLRQHNCTKTLYKESFKNKHLAAKKERKIKGWSRLKKEKLFPK
ncbi:MAG: hypothetical protein KAI43_08265 [Candidatus Aureabacteria bacterium]|nr:hypothetical protein [Candidatus Auribacterota bacterium]